jgi:aminopeptidase N
LDEWGDTWVKRRGLPVIRLSMSRNTDGRITQARLLQQDALGEGGVWPMRIQLLLIDAEGRSETLPLTLQGESTPLAQLMGRAAPRVAFANAGDYGYGIFLLDSDSRAALLQDIEQIGDDLSRSLFWDALWESVRATDLPPAEYLPVALRGLPRERDEVTVGTLLARVQTVFRWYLSSEQQAAVEAELERALRRGMLESATAGLRITWFRAYVAMARSPVALRTLKQLLAGELAIADVALSSHERFRMIRRLLVVGDPDAVDLLAAQAQLDQSDDGRRQAYAAHAAVPDSAAKRAYFSAFLGDASLPERWVEEAVGSLNAVEHEAITLPLLHEALEALPQLKRRHKIFFVNNWLGAFLGGQRSEAALRTVQTTLMRNDLEEDLRRKVLEAVDELERTVRIRARYAG